jgi:hypothetical protein
VSPEDIYTKGIESYEKNLIVGGKLPISSDKLNMSITSSIQDFSAVYVTKVLEAISKKMGELDDKRTNSSQSIP